MPLSLDEIVPGIVAYFDSAALVRDPRVDRFGSDSADTKPNRPYLCVMVSGDDCVWLALTSQNPKGTRLALSSAWRLGGTMRWRTDDVFVRCFAKELRGPASAFVLAAARADVQEPWNRPRLTEDGLGKIQSIWKRKHDRLAGAEIGHDSQPHLSEPAP